VGNYERFMGERPRDGADATLNLSSPKQPVEKLGASDVMGWLHSLAHARLATLGFKLRLNCVSPPPAARLAMAGRRTPACSPGITAPQLRKSSQTGKDIRLARQAQGFNLIELTTAPRRR